MPTICLLHLYLHPWHTHFYKISSAIDCLDFNLLLEKLDVVKKSFWTHSLANSDFTAILNIHFLSFVLNTFPLIVSLSHLAYHREIKFDIFPKFPKTSSYMTPGERFHNHYSICPRWFSKNSPKPKKTSLSHNASPPNSPQVTVIFDSFPP